MTDAEKGEILKMVSSLPHDQKLVALGYLQGLSANSNTDNTPTVPEKPDKSDKNG